MKGFFIILLSLVLLFSTGCSPNAGFFGNYRSIEQLQLVHTLGMDTHRSGVEVSASGGEADSGAEESSGPGMLRLHAVGSNIADAVARLQAFAGKEELYFAHTRYVLVGADYAQNGLGPLMDYLEHSPQLRSDLPLFVVKNGSVKDLIAKAGGKDNTLLDLLESVVRSCARDGIGYPFTCGDIAIYNAQQGSALACALEVVPTAQSDTEAKEEELTPMAAGYAIIKNGSLAGYLSKEAARGVNLLTGQWDAVSVTMVCSGTPISLEFDQVKIDLQPQFGKNGTLAELTVSIDILASGESFADISQTQMNQAVAREITGWIDEIFMGMRSTGTDFLGFGPKVAVKYPHWEGNLELNLSTLPMKAQVTCQVFPVDS